MKGKNIELEANFKFLPKTSIELHWYENTNTGQIIEIKPKIQVRK